jgi:hypothetical protein
LHLGLLEYSVVADAECNPETSLNGLMKAVFRTLKLELRTTRSLRFVDLALEGTEQQTLDLQRFLQNDVRGIR